jgi:hypothetical protein
MSRLIFEYDHLSQLDALPITGGVYAMVFDQAGTKAVDFDAPPYVLSTFVGNQAEHSIPLIKDTTRLRHYSISVSSTSLSIPDNEDGEQYTIEYWGKSIAAATENRTNDKLLKIEKFSWHDSMRPVSRISLAQEQDIVDRIESTEWGQFVTEQVNKIPPSPATANFTCYSAFSFDTEFLRLSCVMWLEKDGAVQLDALSATFELTNSSGDVIGTDTVAVIGDRGQFQGEAILAVDDINADETYYAIIIITDADGVIHKTGAGVVSWD